MNEINLRIDSLFNAFLSNITIEIPHLQIGLFGPSGAGKTMFLRVFKNLVSYQGTIYLNNQLIDHNQIGYMSQDNVFFEHLTLKENFYLLQDAENFNVQNFSEKLYSYLNLFDLSHLLNQSKWSGGQAQRLSLIRLLLQEKYFNVLDEPTSAIDSNNVEIVENLLLNNLKNFLLCSHDIKFLARNCKYFLFLYNGRVLEHGKDILNNPKTWELQNFLVNSII